MTPWLLGAGGAVAALAVVTVAVRRLWRPGTPSVPLRLPVAAADQESVRALMRGEREVEALELLRDRYHLPDADARAVAGDVARDPGYPADWRALADVLDEDLRAEVRELVAQGRRPAALRLLRDRFDLPRPDADRLVTALAEESPGDGA